MESAYLEECFSLDGDILHWRNRPVNHFKTVRAWSTWNSRRSYKKAGCVFADPRRKAKYIVVGINNKRHYAHRIIYQLRHGGIPESMQIDHINGNGLDNRDENMRLATNQENHKNMPLRYDSVSGVAGVSWHKQRNKWVARITVNGMERYLGLYDNLLDAAAARKSAEIEHEFHANHGRAS